MASGRSPDQVCYLAKLLFDKYSSRILIATSAESKSALEISKMFGIPIATCYRKLKELELAGLVVVEDRVQINDEGKYHNLYKSQIEEIAIHFNGDGLKVDRDILGEPSENYLFKTNDFVSEERKSLLERAGIKVPSL